MKLSKLLDPTFDVAIKKLISQEVPLKSAYKLKGIVKQVNEAKAKYEEVRIEALKRFGDKDDAGELVVAEGGSVKLSEENAQGFVKELNDLLNDNVEIGTVKVADLGDKLSLTTTELIALEDILLD